MRKPGNNKTKQLQWTELEGPNRSRFTVSNESVPLPDGISTFPNFVSEEQVERLLKDLDPIKSVWEGFEQRRRVKRFDLVARCTEIPSSLLSLVDMVRAQGLQPDRVLLEEYPPSQLRLNTAVASNHVVTTFESLEMCDCVDGCSCFVAQIPLKVPVVQHMNRPKLRRADCWDLQSPDHWTDFKLETLSMYVRKNESLWDWRSRVVGPCEWNDGDRLVILKLLKLPATKAKESLNTSDPLASIPTSCKEKETNGNNDPLPPLEDVLTVVVTTSPIKSNPSTELIERTFETFIQAGASFAFRCPKIIICDGYRILDEDTNVSRKHANTKQALRNGIATSEQGENYRHFKNGLRDLCASATPDSPFWNTKVEELETRHGYGFALRHALRHCVSTKYVCVIQHDRTFMRPTPLEETVQAMWNHPNIKYVGMSMRSNLMYRDIFLGKYGRGYMEELRQMILRVPELALDAKLYGPNSDSSNNMVCRSAKVRENIQALMDTYLKSLQNLDEEEWKKSNWVEPDKHQLTLTPTLFWYDNTHVSETAHYRDFIFNPSYKMVAKGGFVEDKVSPVMKRSVERMGLAEGHARFGCYLLDDHSGYFFTGHLDGGSYMTHSERQQLNPRRSGSE